MEGAMRSRIVSLCLFAVILTLRSSLHAQNMNLAEAATGGVNGVYVVAGIEDGVNYYQKGSIYLYRYDGSFWVLSVSLGSGFLADIYYYTFSGPDTPDGLTLDTNGDLGTLPGPTINDTSLPVELSSFFARCEGLSVILEWTTESEFENLGFILDRSEDGTVWSTVASYLTHEALKGQGNISSRTEYLFTDNYVESGKKYLYRLSDVNSAGVITQYAPLSVNIEQLLQTTAMENAYPNPFNPQTYIAYHLANSADVNISVFDLQGRKVNSLFTGRQPAGSYHVYWNGLNEDGLREPSGNYIIRLKTENTTQIQKVILMK
jgi:hypothetical protein